MRCAVGAPGGRSAQGNGIGERLLLMALQESLNGMRYIGGQGVILDAKDGVIEFYERYGLEVIDRNERQLQLIRVPTS